MTTGQVEGVAQIYEVSVLLRCPAVHGAGEGARIAAYDADAVTVQTREAGVMTAPPQCLRISKNSPLSTTSSISLRGS